MFDILINYLSLSIYMKYLPLRQRMNADHYCAFMHSFAPTSRIRMRSNGKSSKQFQKALYTYLKERRQLQ